MSYKFGSAVEYCFGCSTCSSGPILLKSSSEGAYLQGKSEGSLNRSKPVRFGLGWSFHFEMTKPQLKVGFGMVWFSQVPVFFQLG